MEYKIFKVVRHSIKIPFFIRISLAVILIFFSSVPILLPIFPFSSVLGVMMLVLGIILVIPPEKMRYLIKTRKSLLYMFKNFSRKAIMRQKTRDIKKHIRKILKKKKNKLTRR